MKYIKLIKPFNYDKNLLVTIYNQLVSEGFIKETLWHEYADREFIKDAKFPTVLSAQKLEAKCCAVSDIIGELPKEAKIYTDLGQLVPFVYSNSINNDGASVYVETGLNAIVSGYMLAKENSKEVTVPESKFSPKLIEQYIKDNLNILKQDNTFLGTWFDKGTWYIDSSERIKSCILAMYLAINRGQLAIYDLNRKESIYTKDFKDIDFSKIEDLWTAKETSYQDLLKLQQP